MNARNYSVATNTSRITEHDIYLFREGNHFRLSDKLGAHPGTHEDQSGVYFAVWAPNARSVSVIGDFNQWNPQVNRMTKAKDGSFRARMKLPPGEFQYKFVVDGMWFSDPAAQAQVINQHGSLNSVIQVK